MASNPGERMRSSNGKGRIGCVSSSDAVGAIGEDGLGISDGGRLCINWLSVPIGSIPLNVTVGVSMAVAPLWIPQLGCGASSDERHGSE